MYSLFLKRRDTHYLTLPDHDAADFGQLASKIPAQHEFWPRHQAEVVAKSENAILRPRQHPAAPVQSISA